MESLVSYGSDDEGSEHYQEMKDSIHGEMDRLVRQGGDDTNYDNVQMDMSEDSNNNNSSIDSSSEDEKSSARSSTSLSSASSRGGGGPHRVNLPPMKERSATLGKKCPSPPSHKDFKAGKDDRRLRESPKGSERSSKVDYEKDHKREHPDSRDLLKQSSSRDKERSRYQDRFNRDKNGRSDRDRRSKSRERRSGSKEGSRKSQSRSKDVDTRRSRSPQHRRGSRSPQSRHSSSVSSYSKHSDLSRSSRSGNERGRRSRSRDRQRSRSRDRRSRSRDQRRSRSRDRRSRSRDRPGKDGHRRRGYDKKPNKLTVLERLGIELRAPEMPPAVTPQQLLQRSIEAQVQQVKSNTGIELPKYYNPAAMNPARYAEQMQKRKLLWGNKGVKAESTEDKKPVVQTSNNKWEGTTFAQDQDGKMTAKFKRLMGIKDAAPSAGASTSSSSSAANGAQNADGNDILKKQEELFNSMEMQYEVARVATHTHRGLGLGFGTFQYPR